MCCAIMNVGLLSIVMLGKKVKELRLQLRLTQEELAGKVKELGFSLTRERISQIERGEGSKATGETTYGLAMALGVQPYVLLGVPAPEPETLVSIPIIGVVPCGTPFPADEFRQGFIDLPVKLIQGHNKDECFAIRASGNSLLGDGIEDGDFLIVSKNTSFIDGKIYIILIGDDVVARHCWLDEDRMRLVASGGAYEQIRATEATILGRVVLSGKWTVH